MEPNQSQPRGNSLTNEVPKPLTTDSSAALGQTGSAGQTIEQPTYSQLMVQLLAQLKSKKSLIFKRTLLMVWPALVLIAVVTARWQTYNCETSSAGAGAYPEGVVAAGNLLSCLLADERRVETLILSIITLFVALYMYIMKVIIGIEKQIWIDSAFDGKGLTSKQSFNLAINLLPAAIPYYLRIYLRYYVPLFFFVLAYFGMIRYLVIYGIPSWGITLFGSANAFMTASVAFFAILPIALFIYLYYLKIKLRNIWFIFLDIYKIGSTNGIKHKGSADFNQAMIQQAAINAVTKTSAFKKILIMNLGADTIDAVTRGILKDIARSTSLYGGSTAFALGQMAQVYGGEASRQFNTFANSVTAYLFYRLALKQVTGNEQIVNADVYSLVR